MNLAQCHYLVKKESNFCFLTLMEVRSIHCEAWNEKSFNLGFPPARLRPRGGLGPATWNPSAATC